MIFFILHQFLFWLPNNGIKALQDNGSRGDHKASVTNANPLFIDQLKCLHALDGMNDMCVDPWDTLDLANKDLWDVQQVLKHGQRKGETEIKAVWNDPNKTSSWIDMCALAIQDPSPILKCAKNKHLLGQKTIFHPFKTLCW